MNLFRNWGIRAKLVSLYVVCIAVPLITANVLIYVHVSQKVEHRYVEYANSLLTQSTTGIDNLVYEMKQVSFSIYTNTQLFPVMEREYDPKHVEQTLDDRDMMSSFLSVIRNLSNYPDGIYIYTESNENYGTDLYAMSPEYDFRTSRWYQVLKNNRRLSWIVLPPRIPRHSLDPHLDLTFVRKIYSLSRPRKVIAYMLIDVPYTRVQPLFGPAVASGSTLLVVGNNNTVYLSNRRDYIGKRMSHAFVTASQEIVSSLTSAVTGWKFILRTNRRNIESNTEGILGFFLLLGVISGLVSILTAWYLARFVRQPLLRLSESMKKVQKGDLGEQFHYQYNDEIGNLGRGFNDMMGRIQELMNTVYLQEILKRDAEIEALMNQINPHFLYNTLQSVQMQATIEKAPRTCDMIERLGKYLRLNLRQVSDFVSVSEEIAYVKQYVDINRIRFGAKLRFECRVDRQAQTCVLPRMILQPLLENSIVHGLEPKRTNWRINVAVQLCDDKICIEVHDSGIGMNKAILDRINERLSSEESTMDRSHGLVNVYKRLSIIFGDLFVFHIESAENDGTTVVLQFPARYENHSN